MAFLSYSQNAFLKWREGLLASLLWMGWQHVIMNLVGAPGGKAFRKDRAYMFGDEFRRYIEDDLIKREPHPAAKPLGVFSISPPAEQLRALRFAGCRANLAIVIAAIVGENSADVEYATEP